MNNKNDLTEYVERLYSAAVKKSGDSFVAEEITQETLLAALQALRRGSEPQNLWAWLMRILSNKYCDYLREKYSKPKISFDDHMLEIADERDSGTDDDYSERLDALHRALGYLAKTHREVMIRFYMRGHSIQRIASELGIPAGTVKSRLNTGRQHIKEGVNDMENYTKQSYEPDILYIACAGSCGLDDEPYSTVKYDDRLAQNVLLLAYEKPVTEIELAKALGVPAAYVEPVVERMVNGELMQRTDGGKLYTDFIIYTDEDRKTNFKKQIETADTRFNLFWKETGSALEAVRKTDYYKRQSQHAQKKLELHFCANTLIYACTAIRDEATGTAGYDYPYRKNGGRWHAMGNKYTADHDFNDGYWKYAISGEAGVEIKNFCGAKQLQLRKFDTELGGYPNRYLSPNYVKWLYEIEKNIPPENSTVGAYVLEAAEPFIVSGILKKDGAVALDLPILTGEEYAEEKTLSNDCVKNISADIRNVMRQLFSEGCVRLPKHLTSVPKWQQYYHCGDSVPMAVIFKAVEKGLFLQGVDYPVPAALIVVDE